MAKPPLENVPTTTTIQHTSSSSSTSTLQKTTKKCIVCGREFSSRNKLFAHLKESECGTAVSASSGKKNDDNHKTNGQGDVGTVNGGSSHNSHNNNNNNNKPQLAKGNEAYYKYYQHQKICNNDEDWADAYRRLRTPLPVTYRIHESSTMGSEFTARLLSLVEKSEGREDDRKVFRHWSFDNNTVSATTNSTAATATNSANNNNEEGDVGNVGNVLPKLRMTITPHCHRRNKSSSNEDDVYSPILHALQELGAIHRQELVSAIPPLVLWTANSKAKGDNNNKNNKNSSGDAMIIADMCAAPGSKSLQLLDMLYYASATKPQNSTNNSTTEKVQTNAIHIPSGLLVVNDSDRHRIVTLCQRSRRVPRAPMLAINMDARYFPGMRRRCKPVTIANTPTKTTTTANNTASKNNSNNNTANKSNNPEKAGYKQKYTTVLCDVPCTGDGTARKNAKIFSQWSVPHSMSLHRLQRRILKRALELLRPGGVVVYSTCSLNPVECEGVVASVIEEVGGVGVDGDGSGGGGDGDGVSGVNDGGGAAMEIVPLHENLTKKCRPMRGVSTWKVPHPQYGKNENYAMYDAFDDVPTEHQGGMGEGNANDDAVLEETQQQRTNQKKKKKKGGQINRSMFPPRRNSELARQLGNCGRFLPTEELDSGGFFVACIRRWKAGELGGRRVMVRGGTTASNTAGDEKEVVVVPAVTSSVGEMGRDETSKCNRSTSSVTTASTTSVGKPSKDESNMDNEESTQMPATSIPTTNEQSHLLREGDWICTLCGKINFGRRGVGSRCFGCKARRHHSATRARGDGNNNEEENANGQGVVVQQPQQQPLLVRPKASVLEAFFECFGIETGEERSFPLEHTRVIRRAKAKEHTIVVVSDALSKLAISESWGPVRELGVTLAAFPREEEQQNDGASSTNTPPASFRLLDEGISILAQCATRRHFQLKPLDFVNAVAQSVRQGCIHAGGGGSTAESERVKATLDKSSVDVDSLGDKDAMWYDSVEEESMLIMWESCKASPGYFIVSCECDIPASSSSSLEGGGGATTGRFSFCGCVDDGGNVEVKTSLRVMAAMLVVLHKYAEIVLLSSGDADDAPVTKRRRL